MYIYIFIFRAKKKKTAQDCTALLPQCVCQNVFMMPHSIEGWVCIGSSVSFGNVSESWVSKGDEEHRPAAPHAHHKQTEWQGSIRWPQAPKLTLGKCE